jgi:purine-binding chemotaxis protein CheW
MTSHDVDRSQPADLHGRLAALESELRVLRRELKAPSSNSGTLPDQDFEVLRCGVGGSFYGIVIDSVREIVRYVQVTPVADVSEVVAGAIDVRGEIVPVIDARRRFGKPATPPRRGTAIVLVALESRSVGLVVDDVMDVIGVTRADLKTPDGLLARAEAVLALATLHENVVQIVDLERVLDAAEWQRLDRAIDSVPPSVGAGDAQADQGDVDGRW